MKRPTNAYIHITENCEHRCDFCYASHGLGGFHNADFDKIVQIIEKCRDIGIKNLSLVGGNPVLHPRIMDILKVAHDTGMRIIVMTNTAFFKDITFAAKYIDVVMVTIHADNERDHDYITKKRGSYSNLISCLQQFSKAGTEIDVAYNITPANYNKIYSSIVSLKSENIAPKRYVLQRIAPIWDSKGNVIKNNEEYCPSKEQVNVAMQQIRQVKDEFKISIELVDPYPLCIVNEAYWDLITPCKCGATDISINGVGDVSRCGADPNYRLGNILVQSIDEIWNKTPELIAFRSMDYLPKKCQECELKIRCRGGCPGSCNFYKMQNQSQLDIFFRQ